MPFYNSGGTGLYAENTAQSRQRPFNVDQMLQKLANILLVAVNLSLKEAKHHVNDPNLITYTFAVGFQYFWHTGTFMTWVTAPKSIAHEFTGYSRR